MALTALFHVDITTAHTRNMFLTIEIDIIT